MSALAVSVTTTRGCASQSLHRLIGASLGRIDEDAFLAGVAPFFAGGFGSQRRRRHHQHEELDGIEGAFGLFPPADAPLRAGAVLTGRALRSFTPRAPAQRRGIRLAVLPGVSEEDARGRGMSANSERGFRGDGRQRVRPLPARSVRRGDAGANWVMSHAGESLRHASGFLVLGCFCSNIIA